MAASNNVSSFVLPGIRIAGAASYLLINLVGLFLSAMLAIVLWKSGDLKSKKTFLIMVCQHLVCDIVGELVQLTMVVPITFAGYGVSSKD
ncbi:hypothetical protein L596_021987 [Steinernema carpocapsae]|uniref:7TM GPCR serpentine receptor class x (Srx) domain-containing protein n=1 Tax=Steinernema carpocapsae TaxID=34508 RepID=A0A4V6A032_STECR|nr:hypothetical protein L596_021987 [Steinernema carpocapsae]